MPMNTTRARYRLRRRKAPVAFLGGSGEATGTDENSPAPWHHPLGSCFTPLCIPSHLRTRPRSLPRRCRIPGIRRTAGEIDRWQCYVQDTATMTPSLVCRRLSAQGSLGVPVCHHQGSEAPMNPASSKVTPTQALAISARTAASVFFHFSSLARVFDFHTICQHCHWEKLLRSERIAKSERRDPY